MENLKLKTDEIDTMRRALMAGYGMIETMLSADISLGGKNQIISDLNTIEDLIKRVKILKTKNK